MSATSVDPLTVVITWLALNVAFVAFRCVPMVIDLLRLEGATGSPTNVVDIQDWANDGHARVRHLR